MILWNKPSEQLYGYTAGEAIGRRLEDLIIPPEMRDDVVETVRAWIEKDEHIPSGEMALRHKDGSTVHVHSSHIMSARHKGGKELFCLDIDLSPQRDTLEALRRSEHVLQKTIEATNDGIWDYNLVTGEFNYSDRWVSMLGFCQGEVDDFGCFCDNHVHPDDKKRFEAAFHDYLEGRSDKYSLELRLRIADGGYKWIYTRGQIVERDQEGKPTRIIGAHTDIDEERRMIEDLGRAKERAEAASLAKSEFLANMSHEIRTPLNGVMGLLQLLRTTTLDEEQTEYVSTALTSGSSLLAVIGDVLDLSRLEAGAMNLNERAFCVRDCAQTITDTFKVQAETKRLELQLVMDADLPEALLGDEMRLRQILFNLVGNAIKFTERGGVALEINRLVTNDGKTALLFTVTDTGIGIPQQRLDEMFTTFTQADGSYRRSYQGAGLGLGIVKKLLTLMDGNGCLESETDRGTTFHFTLRMRQTPERPDANNVPPIPNDCPLSKGLAVLLAEDDRVSQTLTRRMLEKLGAEVVCVSNGRDAVGTLDERSFDVVLMDIQMPGMDGMEACQLIRESEQKRGIPPTPIVALTAHAMAGDRETFLASGMDAYLPKPVEMDKLAYMLHRMGGGKEKDNEDQPTA